jgi:hypothetical protein
MELNPDLRKISVTISVVLGLKLLNYVKREVIYGRYMHCVVKPEGLTDDACDGDLSRIKFKRNI